MLFYVQLCATSSAFINEMKNAFERHLCSFIFFVSEVTFLDETVHGEVQPVVEALDFVGEELLGDTVGTEKLLSLRAGSVVELGTEMSPDSFSLVSLAEDSLESASGEGFVVNLLRSHVDELVSIIEVGELLPRSVRSLNDVAEDDDSSWGKQPGNFFHKLLGISRMKQRIVTENEIERAVLQVMHLVKALLQDLKLGLWDLFLLCLGEVVVVFSLAKVHRDHDVQLVELDKFFGNDSCETTAARSELESSHLAVGGHIFIDELEHLGVSEIEWLDGVGRNSVLVSES